MWIDGGGRGRKGSVYFVCLIGTSARRFEGIDAEFLYRPAELS